MVQKVEDFVGKCAWAVGICQVIMTVLVSLLLVRQGLGGIRGRLQEAHGSAAVGRACSAPGAGGC